MPRLTVAPLFAADDLLIRRVTCDGVDAPRPVDEGADDSCVVLVLQGRFTFRDTDGRAVASPAAALCLPAGHTYRIRHVDDEGDLCVSMKGDLCRSLVEAGPIVRRVSAEGYVHIRRVAATLAQGAPVERLAIEEAWCSTLSPAVRPPRESRAAARRIVEAITYELERNVGTRATLSALARAAGVSVFHACRVFKEVTGVTMHGYQHETRLRHALAWLLDSDRPIAQIAADLGFAHQPHLTTAFRRRFHSTPARTRRTGRITGLPAPDRYALASPGVQSSPPAR